MNNKLSAQFIQCYNNNNKLRHFFLFLFVLGICSCIVRNSCNNVCLYTPQSYFPSLSATNRYSKKETESYNHCQRLEHIEVDTVKHHTELFISVFNSFCGFVVSEILHTKIFIFGTFQAGIAISNVCLIPNINIILPRCVVYLRMGPSANRCQLK